MSQWMELADKIIDLGADFRLQDQARWQYWYGKKHMSPSLLGKFQYGIPEIYRDRIKSARLVAGPGCEAIVSILCLYPFIKQGLISGDRIIIDAKMGSSQVGNKPSSSTHHPERAGVVRSYKPSGHRHGAEIEQRRQTHNQQL